jgi:hypothetical protein
MTNPELANQLKKNKEMENKILTSGGPHIKIRRNTMG